MKELSYGLVTNGEIETNLSCPICGESGPTANIICEKHNPLYHTNGKLDIHKTRCVKKWQLNRRSWWTNRQILKLDNLRVVSRKEIIVE